jgi:HAE1 family hydrophobic/amphiphilic exporter-1
MNRDMANVLAQNRVSQAQSRLPQEVIQQGVTVKKINPSILMVISLYSPRGTRDAQFLNNYAMINIRDALLRVPGIAQVDLYGGAEYGMRVWLRPDRLTALGLTPADVIAAIKEQNLQAPAGQVGAAPSAPGQEFTYTVRPRAGSSRRKSSRTSSSSRRPTAARCASRTSGAPSWAARITSRSAAPS